MLVDQNPISRSPAAARVTVVKAFDEVRQVFAETTDAKIRGLSAGHFSFNSPWDAVHAAGDGVLQIDMQFLADVFMTRPECHGCATAVTSCRYAIAIVHRRGAAHDRPRCPTLFRGQEKLQLRLGCLASVGLDYLQLGQPATTLSAGEAQRLKLAGFLAGATKRKTLFILDEPTTGLHTHDIVQLLDCMDALVEAGHSLVVVEHNLHLIAAADHIIDIGPGPAAAGGRVVAAGTPQQIMQCGESITGRYLTSFLSRRAADA